MDKTLNEITKEIKDGQRPVPSSEAETIWSVIMPILRSLGWDVFSKNEIQPEYSVGGKSVDIALMHRGHPRVFIEAKKATENLESHQRQLCNYAFEEGVGLAVLTNGATWWFYLPISEGNWEQRKFCAIDFYEQDSDEIVRRFKDYISKSNVSSGKALQYAEETSKKERKRHTVEKTLPRAWNAIISGPDEALLDLIAVRTESLCGSRPTTEVVENFIVENLHHISPPRTEGRTRRAVRLKKDSGKPGKPSKKSYRGKSVTAFGFKGVRYATESWRNVLITICDIIAKEKGAQFDRVLTLGGAKRPYFSRDSSDLRTSRRISGTDIYVEVNLSAQSIVRLSKRVLALFGHKASDLSINAS